MPYIELGSSPECDVVLKGPGIAPMHVRVVRMGIRTVLEPSADVSVYGQALVPGKARVINSQPFQIGDYDVRVFFP